MTLKDHVIREVDQLDEKGLEQLADFISNLKKSHVRSRRRGIVITAEMAKLYAQLAQEDTALAECGMSDYAKMLGHEDK